MAMNPFDIDNEVILELIKSDPTLSELYGFSNAESAAPMADLVDELSQYSRGDDRNLAHVAPGDTIIPPELLEADPEFADLVYGRLADAGIDPAKRVVDSGAANRNPATGAQEFDWDMDGRWSGDGMNAVMYNPPAGGTAADFLEGGGGYSFEDFYGDLLNMDAQQQQDFLRSQGLLEGGVGPYVGATGGTGPITDETRAGEPMPPTTPTTTAPDNTTFNTLMDQLQSGQYTYGAAGAARDSGQLTPEQFDQFTEAFNQYTGTVPGQRPYSVGETVTGPYTPPAETGTTETTEPTSGATVGTTTPAGGSRTYAGVPQEILDMIEVGVEIPLPGPGNLPLPIIFGSVGEFIDWVQSVGIDPTTGNPDDFMGTVGRVLGDIFNTAKGAIQGSIRGATTGQVNQIDQFIRDLIKAGTTDAGTIINAAQDALPSILGGGGGGRAGIPPTTGTTTTTGGTGTDIGLPGGEEEDDKAPAETAEPGVPNEEVLGQMGTNQQEVLGKIDQAIAQGTANAEVLDQIARDLGTTKEELLSAMGTTEENLIDYMEGMEGRLNERLDTLGTNQEEILGKVNEAIAQGASNAEALEQVAQDLGTTKEELLSAMGTTEENLMGYVDAATDRVLEQMGTNQQEVLGKLEEAIAQGASNAEALEQVAQDLGTTKEELLGAMGTSEENLKGYMDGVEGRLTERLDVLETGLYDKMQENLDAGMARADAIDKALEDLATEQGKSKDEILDQMGTNQDALMGRMDELEEGFNEALGGVRDDLTDLINAGIEAGKTQTEALGDALEELAEQQGKSTEELKDEIGMSEDRLLDALGGFEERMFDQMGADKDDIIDRVDDAIEQGKSNGEALADLAEELGVSVDYLMDALGTTEENLTDLINESQTAILDELGTTKAEILDSVNEAIAEGKSANEALDELAEQLGTTTEDLLDAVDVSTDTIMDELAAFEERQNERLDNATDEILGKVQEGIDTGKTEREALGDALDEIADDLGMTREEILDQLGTTEDRILDEIGTSTDVITRDISDLGMQTSLQNLIGLLAQPGTFEQRVDVSDVPLAEIEDLYDFATIFRTPEEAAFYASAIQEALDSGAITEEELMALIGAQ